MSDTKKNKIIEYTPLGEKMPIQLSREIVVNQVVSPTSSGIYPSDKEILQFMMLCRARQLNPFTKDCFLLGYDTRNGAKFSIITAKSSLDKRAESNPNNDGLESGLILKGENSQQVFRDGAVFDKTDELDLIIGAWAKSYRKDRGRPYFHTINRSAYDPNLNLVGNQKPNPRWQQDLGGMLVKCAEAGALRKAFPNEFSGMYLSEEIDAETERVTQGTVLNSEQVDGSKQATPVESPLFKSPVTPATTGNNNNQDNNGAPPAQDEATAAEPGESEESSPATSLETLMQLAEVQGIPKEQFLFAAQQIGIGAMEIEEITDSEIDLIAESMEEMVELYELEVKGK